MMISFKAEVAKILYFGPILPHYIAKTTLRPDIVLVSETMKSVVTLKLTVLRVEEAFELKREKYEGLVCDCLRQG